MVFFRIRKDCLGWWTLDPLCCVLNIARLKCRLLTADQTMSRKESYLLKGFFDRWLLYKKLQGHDPVFHFWQLFTFRQAIHTCLEQLNTFSRLLGQLLVLLKQFLNLGLQFIFALNQPLGCLFTFIQLFIENQCQLQCRSMFDPFALYDLK